jgi:hypothetical protein
MQKELSYSEEQGKAIRGFTSKPHMSKKISEKYMIFLQKRMGLNKMKNQKTGKRKYSNTISVVFFFRIDF